MAPLREMTFLPITPESMLTVFGCFTSSAGYHLLAFCDLWGTDLSCFPNFFDTGVYCDFASRTADIVPQDGEARGKSHTQTPKKG